MRNNGGQPAAAGDVQRKLDRLDGLAKTRLLLPRRDEPRHRTEVKRWKRHLGLIDGWKVLVALVAGGAARLVRDHAVVAAAAASTATVAGGVAVVPEAKPADVVPLPSPEWSMAAPIHDDKAQKPDVVPVAAAEPTRRVPPTPSSSPTASDEAATEKVRTGEFSGSPGVDSRERRREPTTDSADLPPDGESDDADDDSVPAPGPAPEPGSGPDPTDNREEPEGGSTPEPEPTEQPSDGDGDDRNGVVGGLVKTVDDTVEGVLGGVLGSR